MKNNFLIIILSLFLAIGVSFITPSYINNKNNIEANITNNNSLIKQKIISYNKDEKFYQKIYVDGKLIGVINDIDFITKLINEKYKEYEEEFPNSELGFRDNIYITSEKTYARFENIDDKIFNYLNDNNLLGIRVESIEFSTSEGIYDIIYVKDEEDFYKALRKFYLNFINEDSLDKLQRNEIILSPEELGVVDKKISLYETISEKSSFVSPEEIFKDEDEIYEFLCYGRNQEREYYVVKEGDTLQGVGHYFGDMSPKQLALINNNLNSENQVILPGMELNVTYYLSPITVEVTKDNLSQQLIAPEAPEYIEDETLEKGTYEIKVQEEFGIKNVLYEEKWVNGILIDGELLAENIIKQAKQGVILVGTKQSIRIGTGNYVWPVDNPEILCAYGCYAGHTGTDFINKYDRYAPIYAVDNGVVSSVGYQYDMGYYCMIDHQNGVKTIYMHLNVPAYVEVGQSILRGQTIGQMGITGYATAVHLHLTFEVNGYRVDACNYLPCSLLN